MKNKTYIIEDWTGKRCFPDKEFESFEEGWSFIYKHVDNSEYDKTGKDDDNAYQEYYVVVKKLS